MQSFFKIFRENLLRGMWSLRPGHRYFNYCRARVGMTWRFFRRGGLK